MNKLKKILIVLGVSILLVGVVVSLTVLFSSRREMTYEEYNALSAEEQEAYFNSFDTIEDFFAWYNKAKAEYEASQDYTEIGGDGNLDIGEAENDK
jgi:flagellar basal body-associated protein FliL